MSTEASFQRAWDNAGPLKGLVPEAYFAARALALPTTNSLRFAASLSHKSGGSYPAIIAQATSAAGVVTGGQRIFLAHDGKGKAPVDKKLQKMSLGIIKGSMVRLAEPIDGVPLLIGEGVETLLTTMQASGYPGGATLGALNANGVPDGAKDVILLGENDGGKNVVGVAKTAPELLRKGIRVRVAYPPEGFKDFNDMVKDAADQTGWIPTRSATPSTALVPQQKVGFPIPNAGLLLGFQGTKTARREGRSSPFRDAGGCTSPQNSGWDEVAARHHRARSIGSL
jgi:Toprim domain